MAPALVQATADSSTTEQSGNPITFALQFPSNTTAGNTLFCVMFATSGGTSVAPSGPVGWTLVDYWSDGSLGEYAVFSLANASSIASTTTLTFSINPGFTTYGWAVLFEMSGLGASTLVLDGSPTSHVVSSGSPTSVASTTLSGLTGSYDLALCLGAASGGPAISSATASGWTNIVTASGTWTSAGWALFKVLSQGATSVPSFTTSWSGGAVSAVASNVIALTYVPATLVTAGLASVSVGANKPGTGRSPGVGSVTASALLPTTNGSLTVSAGLSSVSAAGQAVGSSRGLGAAAVTVAGQNASVLGQTPILSTANVNATIGQQPTITIKPGAGLSTVVAAGYSVLHGITPGEPTPGVSALAPTWGLTPVREADVDAAAEASTITPGAQAGLSAITTTAQQAGVNVMGNAGAASISFVAKTSTVNTAPGAGLTAVLITAGPPSETITSAVGRAIPSVTANAAVRGVVAGCGAVFMEAFGLTVATTSTLGRAAPGIVAQTNGALVLRSVGFGSVVVTGLGATSSVAPTASLVPLTPSALAPSHGVVLSSASITATGLNGASLVNPPSSYAAVVCATLPAPLTIVQGGRAVTSIVSSAPVVAPGAVARISTVSVSGLSIELASAPTIGIAHVGAVGDAAQVQPAPTGGPATISATGYGLTTANKAQSSAAYVLVSGRNPAPSVSPVSGLAVTTVSGYTAIGTMVMGRAAAVAAAYGARNALGPIPRPAAPSIKPQTPTISTIMTVLDWTLDRAFEPALNE